MSVHSPAPTVTRSFAHRATGKHTLLLTLKARSRRNTSLPERATKPKCPRATYLCLTSLCRSPSSSQTTVKTSSGLVFYCFFLTESASHTEVILPPRPDPVSEPPPRFSAVPGGQRSSVQVPVLQQSLQEIQPSETARQVRVMDGAMGRVHSASEAIFLLLFLCFLPTPGLTPEKGPSSVCSAAGASPLQASSRPTSGPTPA